MKTVLARTVLFAAVLLASTGSQAAVNVDYRNHDSQAREFTALCSGSRATIEFNAGTTGSATLQGSAPCIIKQGSEEIVLNGGEDVEIKNGLITIVD